ncbi:uncharacterized protein TNCV_2377121 [Trichonephila clavipes]|nr:uncharacterized protein TNCV_2377121 [Trichonephila clavipes]
MRIQSNICGPAWKMLSSQNIQELRDQLVSAWYLDISNFLPASYLVNDWFCTVSDEELLQARYICVTNHVTLTAGPWSLGSNPGEGMDFCKCILPVRHWSTLNIRRVASPFERLMEGGKRWKASDSSQGVVLSQNWGGTEPNRTATCMVLKAATNDRPLPR